MILETCELTGERSLTPGIGFGTPRKFSFKATEPVTENWSITNSDTPVKWSVTPNNEFLRFTLDSSTSDIPSVGCAIRQPFTSENTVVTVAFQVRLNQIDLDTNDTLLIHLPGAPKQVTNEWLSIVISGGNINYGWVDSDSETHMLAGSDIKTDGKWAKIVMAIEAGSVQLWENDVLKFTWAPVLPIEDHIWVSFGGSTNGVLGGLISFDISDLSVLVGFNQLVRVKRSISDGDPNTVKPYLDRVKSHWSGVEAAVAPVARALASLDIGPSALFWGIDIPISIQRLVNDLETSTAIKNLGEAVAQSSTQARTTMGPTFYFGIGVSAEFVIAGGYSIGFLVGTHSPKIAVVTLNAGAATNIGVQAAIDMAWMFNDSPEFLGLGAYLQMDFGEFVQGSLGVSGNVPLHMRAWDNCGPSATIGVGVSALPVDAAGGLSYTWKIAQL